MLENKLKSFRHRLEMNQTEFAQHIGVSVYTYNQWEKQNIPILAAFGREKIAVYEFAPDDTPERIAKARTTLVTTVKQARRVLEIQA